MSVTADKRAATDEAGWGLAGCRDRLRRSENTWTYCHCSWHLLPQRVLGVSVRSLSDRAQHPGAAQPIARSRPAHPSE